MERQVLRRFLWTAAVIAVLFVLCVMLTALYYEPTNGILYTTRVNTSVIVGAMPPSIGAIRAAMLGLEWTFVACMVSELIVLLVTRRQQASVLRCVVAVVSCIVLYWGWLGFFAIPSLFWTGLDGEALAEHLLTLSIGAMWISWSIAVLWASWNWRTISLRLLKSQR